MRASPTVSQPLLTMCPTVRSSRGLHQDLASAAKGCPHRVHSESLAPLATGPSAVHRGPVPRDSRDRAVALEAALYEARWEQDFGQPERTCQEPGPWRRARRTCAQLDPPAGSRRSRCALESRRSRWRRWPRPGVDAAADHSIAKHIILSPNHACEESTLQKPDGPSCQALQMLRQIQVG